MTWCQTCRSHPHLEDQAGAFYRGSKSFSHPLFEKHEKSKEHINVVEGIANKEAIKEEMCSRPAETSQTKQMNENPGGPVVFTELCSMLFELVSLWFRL